MHSILQAIASAGNARVEPAEPAGPQIFLALDSDHADYAAVVAALSNVSSEDSTLDSTIKIITADDPVTRTGDLAPIDRTNIGEGVFEDEYLDNADYIERAYPHLGNMANTPYPEMTGLRYIREERSGGYKDGDGLTPGRAFNGLRSNAINGGSSRVMQGGIQYFACGVHHRSASAFGTLGGDVDFADASSTERVEVRCDHPLMPGVILGTFTHIPSGAKGDPWVHEGGNIYSQADWGNGTQNPFQSVLFVTSAIDPAASEAWNRENAIYNKAADETSLVPGNWFSSDGIKMYVRMLDDNAPPAGFNIANRWDNLGGYFLQVNGGKNIKLHNVRHFAGGESSSEMRKCTDLTVAGGQYALHAGASGGDYFRSGNATHWKFCAATYGRLTYDRSDIVYDGEVVDQDHRLVQELISAKGSSASAFADMDQWCMLMHLQNGPGLNNATATNLDNVDGLYVVDCNIVLSNSRGTIATYSHDDGHGLSARNGGMENRTWQRFVLLRGGRHYDFYASATGEANAPYAGSGTNMKDNISQDFLILGTNGRASGIGKAAAGLGWEHDNDNVPSLDGTGDKTGNIFRRFAIAGIDPTDMTGAAINNVIDAEVLCEDYIIEDCNYHYLMGRNFQESVPYCALVTDSGATVNEVTTNLLNGTGGGTNTTVTLDAVGDYIVFGFIGSNRFFDMDIDTAAVGTYTLAFEEMLSTGWTAVDNLSDGTSALTSVGGDKPISWNRNDDMVATDVGVARDLHLFRIRLASGLMVTKPVINRLRGRRIGSAFKSRGATVRGLVTSWNTTNSSLTPVNSSYVDIDDYEWELLAGQDPETDLICNNGNSTYEGWQTAASGFFIKKAKLTTDAFKDSNHGANVPVENLTVAS